MLNLHNMVKAPVYHFEVQMERKKCLNANQNTRRRMEYVKAHNADEAKKAAQRLRPEFVAVSARRV